MGKPKQVEKLEKGTYVIVALDGPEYRTTPP